MSKTGNKTSFAYLPYLPAGFFVSEIVVADIITDAFSAGKASLNMHCRYEAVDDGNPLTENERVVH